MSDELLHFHWWPRAHLVAALKPSLAASVSGKWNAELIRNKTRERWKSPSSWKGIGKINPKNPSIFGWKFSVEVMWCQLKKGGRLRIGGFSGRSSAWTNWSFHSMVLGHSCAGNQENGGWCVFGRFWFDSLFPEKYVHGSIFTGEPDGFWTINGRSIVTSMKVSPAIMGPKILSEPAKKKHSLLFGSLVTIWSLYISGTHGLKIHDLPLDHWHLCLLYFGPATWAIPA